MKYLTYRERVQIETLYKINTPVPVIASQLGRAASTIYKELHRGKVILRDTLLKEYVSYSADIAQQKHEYAQTSKGRPLKIGNDHAFAAYIEHKVKEEKYSPAAALAAARNTKRFETTLSVNTLYSYIYKGYVDILPRHLLRGRPKKAKQHRTPPKVPFALSIDKRLEYINDRSELGHWEMDCVCSKQGKKAALLVLTERKSRYELIYKIPNKEMKTVVGVLDQMEEQLGPAAFSQRFKSITVDNGSEFRDYDGLRLSSSGSARTEIYYCHPYCSSERGSNENANSIIRRWFPKGTDFTDVTQAEVDEVQDWMNHYPRKVLGWISAVDLMGFPS